MKIIRTLVVFLLILTVKADGLECQKINDKFFIYNINNNTHMGNIGFEHLYQCTDSIKFSKAGHICAVNHRGFSVHNIDTGKVIGNFDSYYYKLSSCTKSLRFMTQNIVCLPKNSGAGVFDINENYFIGPSAYSSVDYCVWASSSATETEVCAIYKNGYSAIYNRRYNSISRGEFYTYVQNCSYAID